MATNSPYNLNMTTRDIHIGTMPLQTIREIHKKHVDVELCEEASFMKGDNQRLYNVIAGTVTDILDSKRGRGRPSGSKNKDKK